MSIIKKSLTQTPININSFVDGEKVQIEVKNNNNNLGYFSPFSKFNGECLMT